MMNMIDFIKKTQEYVDRIFSLNDDSVKNEMI